MIEETATVIAIEQGQLVLQVSTRTACGGCAAKKGCGTAALSGWLGRKMIHIRADNTVDARVGDEVVVGLGEDALLSGSVRIYLLPLLGLMLSAILADQLLDAGLQGRDLLVMLAAVAGFGVVLSGTRSRLLVDSRIGRLSPVVLRIAARRNTAPIIVHGPC
jgi:sigma-E factor negative regulatory protein RseC